MIQMMNCRLLISSGLTYFGCPVRYPPMKRIITCFFCLSTAIGLHAQHLEITTKELIFSTTLDEVSAPQFVEIRNTGDKRLLIQEIVAVGSDDFAFEIRTSYAFPMKLRPQERAKISVAFNPDFSAGFMRANLRITSNNPAQGTHLVALYGLSTKGLEGENEPPLAQILSTLGYAVNVGGTSLALGTDVQPMGEEIAAPLFVKAGEGAVTMHPVARYSPPELVPFGYYLSSNQPQIREVGILSGDSLQHQTLFPVLASGERQFDPGVAAFGLFTATKAHPTYSEDRFNLGVPHAVRVFPLKNREENLVNNSYLICFEEAKNGDYQDFVFVLSNVKPAQEQ